MGQFVYSYIFQKSSKTFGIKILLGSKTQILDIANLKQKKIVQ